MKNIIKLSIFCAILLIFSACSFFKNSDKITNPEYVKIVVKQNLKFNNMIGDVLDQIETFTGTSASVERLNGLIDSTIELIDYLKNDLGPKVPDESLDHYNSMMEAYDLYKEGLLLYKTNVPLALGNERKENIKLAEDKFEQAREKLQSIK